MRFATFTLTSLLLLSINASAQTISSPVADSEVLTPVEVIGAGIPGELLELRVNGVLIRSIRVDINGKFRFAFQPEPTEYELKISIGSATVVVYIAGNRPDQLQDKQSEENSRSPDVTTKPTGTKREKPKTNDGWRFDTATELTRYSALKFEDWALGVRAGFYVRHGSPFYGGFALSMAVDDELTGPLVGMEGQIGLPTVDAKRVLFKPQIIASIRAFVGDLDEIDPISDVLIERPRITPEFSFRLSVGYRIANGVWAYLAPEIGIPLFLGPYFTRVGAGIDF